MHALSQLSYGPWYSGKCSAELEIFGPIDADSLVVAARRQAQINLRAGADVFGRSWQRSNSTAAKASISPAA
jgi:hypothetical protein